MIDISQIGQLNRRYRYHFPTIDFKFQNTGNATAFLWQFGISILSAEINLTPIINFGMQIKDNALEIIAINNGWGDARDWQVRIDESILNQLFSDSILSYNGILQSGEQQNIFRLTKKLADPNQFQLIKRFFTDIVDEEYPYYRSSSTKKTIHGIKLGNLSVKWNCKDDKGINYSGEQTIRNPWGDCILTENGFIEVTHLPAPGAAAGSDVTFIAMIDPSKGTHERQYTISRKIPPGDIERFHIMIGAPKSCRLRTQFKFHLDRDAVIKSEEFDVEIWNPRNSYWNADYADGSEIDRYKENTRYYYRDAEYLERQLSNYPFLEKNDLRRF